eukprot:767717-Hanusia_phi.AAC.2
MDAEEENRLRSEPDLPACRPAALRSSHVLTRVQELTQFVQFLEDERWTFRVWRRSAEYSLPRADRWCSFGFQKWATCVANCGKGEKDYHDGLVPHLKFSIAPDCYVEAMFVNESGKRVSEAMSSSVCKKHGGFPGWTESMTVMENEQACD